MLRKLSVAASILLACCLATFSTAQQTPTFTVMTQNMDAGTDLGFALYGLQQLDPRPYVDLTLAEVDASGIPLRASELAQEIASAKPDIVSLQEVSLWRTGTSVATATTVRYDQLQLLMTALQNALHGTGFQYRVVAVNNLTDLALPTTETGPGALRLTDRDVMLARSDLPPSKFQLSDVHVHVYKAALELGGFTVHRGFISAQVRIDNQLFRIADTHLENNFPGVDNLNIQALQAEELLSFMRNWPQPVILSGDFNADAIQGTDGPGPDNTATVATIEGAGYSDSWAVANSPDPGATWPLFLEDQTPPNFFTNTTPWERIDLIFSKKLDIVSSEQVGAGLGYMNSASDHTGVITTFRLDR